MKINALPKRPSRGFLPILITLVFLFLAAGVEAACPKPFTKQKLTGDCVLNKSEVIATTIAIEPNTTLNCMSHTIRATKGGTGTKTGERSVPEVAFFLDGRSRQSVGNVTQNIQIKNCALRGFDFGVFGINSKRRASMTKQVQIQILNNTISARFVAVNLMTVDDAEIKGNTLEFKTIGGRAIYVGRDSDRNLVADNQITAKLVTTGDQNAVRVPGPVSDANPIIGPDSPNAFEGSAVLITQTEGPEPSLLNAVIEKRLFQLIVTRSDTPNKEFSQGNQFSGNTITFQPGGEPLDGVVMAIPQGTLVSNNTISGASLSIRVGIQFGGPRKQFPGTCSVSRRPCLGNTDCKIAGVDPIPTRFAPKSTCRDLPDPQPVFWLSRNNVIRDNTINGPFLFGIVTVGEGTTISGNTITGDGTGTGIRLGAFSVGPTTTPPTNNAFTEVSRNRVRSLGVCLLLSQRVGTNKANAFAARVSLNDFTDCPLLVQLSEAAGPDASGGPFYNLDPSELSVSLKGNHWGLTCADGGFDPGRVKNSNTPASPNTGVQDTHPFGVPVALDPLLSPCP